MNGALTGFMIPDKSLPSGWRQTGVSSMNVQCIRLFKRRLITPEAAGDDEIVRRHDTRQALLLHSSR